jgi:hypothetical protein
MAWLAGRRWVKMAGVSVVIIVFVLVVAIPVGVLITGGVVAAILGWLAKSDAEQRYEGTEYVDMGV